MKIGMIMPLIYMSTKLYPGRIFAPRDLCLDLCDNLVDLGNEVFLFSSANVGRQTKAKIISINEEVFSSSILFSKLKNRPKDIQKLVTFELKKRIYEQKIILNAFAFAKKEKLDLLHSYHDTMTFLTHHLNHFFDTPVIYSVHDALPPEGTLEYLLYKEFENDQYLSISDSQRKSSLNLNFVKTIYHGLNLAKFPFREKDDGYFLFMGRLVPEKGLATAMRATISLNYPLFVGTTIGNEEKQSDYYQSQVEPLLNNPLIRKPGFVDKEGKTKLYQGAKALLFPIEWEEAFGIVLIEALACGTPVIAFSRGSVPEIIKDNQTGLIVDPKEGLDGFIKAAKKLLELPQGDYLKMRQNCRQDAEDRFTALKMAKDYQEVYKQILNKKPGFLARLFHS